MEYARSPFAQEIRDLLEDGVRGLTWATVTAAPPELFRHLLNRPFDERTAPAIPVGVGRPDLRSRLSGEHE